VLLARVQGADLRVQAVNVLTLKISASVLPAGQPPKRFRKGGDENVHDMQSFIGRGVSNLKGLRSRVWSKKDTGRTSIDELSDVSATAAAAEDKV
jgi:hypothetical protein